MRKLKNIYNSFTHTVVPMIIAFGILLTFYIAQKLTFTLIDIIKEKQGLPSYIQFNNE
jgi:hypothetical protein